MTKLDLRDCTLTGDDLKAEILNRVRETQHLIITTLPDLLILTPEQYKDLEHDPEMQAMHESNQRVYVTPDNAMEVEVLDDRQR